MWEMKCMRSIINRISRDREMHYRSANLGKYSWHPPAIGVISNDLPKNALLVDNSSWNIQFFDEQLLTAIGGLWLTCSARNRQFLSGRTHSKVSPRMASKGRVAVRLAVCAYPETANAVT